MTERAVATPVPMASTKDIIAAATIVLAVYGAGAFGIVKLTGGMLKLANKLF